MPSASEVAVCREQARRAHAVLQRRPEGYRRVLRLRLEEGLSFVDIGVRLGRTRHAARQLYYRARERFAQALADDPPRRLGVG